MAAGNRIVQHVSRADGSPEVTAPVSVPSQPARSRILPSIGRLTVPEARSRTLINSRWVGRDHREHCRLKYASLKAIRGAFVLTIPSNWPTLAQVHRGIRNHKATPYDCPVSEFRTAYSSSGRQSHRRGTLADDPGSRRGELRDSKGGNTGGV